jgi:two-component system response regulator YesN
MLKVFMAEDEFVVRDGIRKNVDWRGHGYDFCGEASDGELALPMIRKLRPDIIITDIRMPFMDGLELAKLVRRELPGTEIIILTGYEKFEYAKKGIEIGVSEYLLKPVKGDDLLKAVDSAAGRIREKQKDLELFERYSRHMQEHDAVISPEDEELDLQNVDTSGIDQTALLKFLREGNAEDVDDFVEKSFGDSARGAMKSTVFRQYVVIDAFMCVNRFCRNLSGKDGKEAAVTEFKADRIRSEKDVLDYIRMILSEAIKMRDEAAGSRYSDVVGRAISYIEENYAKEDLSLEVLSEHVGFSPGHFSAVFSRETGIPFIKYLTDFRMKKARDLLKCTSKRSSEIAFLVGYKDPHYFSYLFKKTHNMTPTQYREGKN